MTQEDIEALRNRSKLITQEEIEKRKRDLYLSQKAIHDKADMRKTKMKELEEEAKKHVPSIEAELNAIETANPMLKQVYERLDADADDVKTLKSRLNRMKYETVMKKQIQEKKEIQNYEKKIDDAWEEEMEQRRIDEIQKYRQQLEEQKRKNADFVYFYFILNRKLKLKDN